MKTIFNTIVAVFLFVFFVSPAFAAPQFNWGKELNASACEKVGRPVVNVMQKVVNDVDSGLSGNWAFDSLNRQIQVWETATTGAYCAEVSYQGKFDARAGQVSPGDQAVALTGDEDGSFHGGYRATVTGTLLASPLWGIRGQVGTTDYACDLAGNCPGYVDWVAQYFEPNYGFAYEWWGWIYRSGSHVWVNASTGNSGDVL